VNVPARDLVQTMSARISMRALILLGLVALAYPWSLVTLSRSVTLQTPLAYLALVPVVALLLARVALTRQPAPRPIHDRQLDYIIGLGLIFMAAAILLFMPDSLRSRFWLYRIDLLTVPFFVAGVVTLLYGVRRMWALRVPILFLFLAWPVPYLPLVGDGLRAFTDLSVAAAAVVSGVFPAATPTGSAGLFLVHHAEQPFTLLIGSACAGVNSMVGFLVIGLALGYVVHGPLWRKAVWLIDGLVLVWIFNLLRIESIFGVGAMFGRGAAYDVLHPVAGLLFFNVAILIMLGLIPLFGLRWRPAGDPAGASALTAPRGVGNARRAGLVTLAFVLAFAAVNAGYARYQSVLGDFVEPRLQPFALDAMHIDGWLGRHVATYQQGKQFFGQESEWDRYFLTSSPRAALYANTPVYLDVITTDDYSALAAYGIEACYDFHGFQIASIAAVDLGSGVNGEIISYTKRQTNTDWTTLYWEWPYRSNGETRFARVVMLVPQGPIATIHSEGADAWVSATPRFQATEQLLIALARQVIATQLPAPDQAAGR
jgi:exosortase/archaeosortase family protein